MSADPAPRREEVLGLPDHLTDALWRVDSARLQTAGAAGVLVCGDGVAARGAELAVEALDGRLRGPLLVLRGGSLPEQAAGDWTVLCSSYSGETVEALACFEQAGALAARRIVAATGGTLVDRAREAGVPVVGLPAIVEPSAALGYFFVAAAETAALAGIAPRIAPEVEAAARFLAERREQIIAEGTVEAAEASSAVERVLLAAWLDELERAA